MYTIHCVTHTLPFTPGVYVTELCLLFCPLEYELYKSALSLHLEEEHVWPEVFTWHRETGDRFYPFITDYSSNSWNSERINKRRRWEDLKMKLFFSWCVKHKAPALTAHRRKLCSHITDLHSYTDMAAKCEALYLHSYWDELSVCTPPVNTSHCIIVDCCLTTVWFP